MATAQGSADEPSSPGAEMSEETKPEAVLPDSQQTVIEDVGGNGGGAPEPKEPDEGISHDCSEASSTVGDSESSTVRENGDASASQSESSVPPSPSPSSQSATPDDKKGRKRFGFLDRLARTSASNTPRTNTKSYGVASSTTGLIFENRPANLPAKSPAEEQRHRRQYEAMLEAAKQKEKREAQVRERQAQERVKREEQASVKLSVWVNEILPHWSTMYNTKKTRELWWQGLPPSVRGQVWRKALGNDLHITQDLYEISLSRAAEMLKLGVRRADEEQVDSSTNGTELLVSAKSREGSVELIHLDVKRTFPSLGIFQEGGPLHRPLHDVLGAYACYRPDMGYVQGMSFLAAILILNMDPQDAFISLANVLCRPTHMAFYRVDETQMKVYFNTFTALVEEHLPRIHAHFKDQKVTPELFLVDWFFTMYSKSLPLDIACRVWDVFFRDGDEFLFRTGLGILHLYQSRMLQMEFIELARFFTRLPDDMSADELFHSISLISLTTKHYTQVVAQQRESLALEATAC